MRPAPTLPQPIFVIVSGALGDGDHVLQIEHAHCDRRKAPYGKGRGHAGKGEAFRIMESPGISRDMIWRLPSRACMKLNAQPEYSVYIWRIFSPSRTNVFPA